MEDEAGGISDKPSFQGDMTPHQTLITVLLTISLAACTPLVPVLPPNIDSPTAVPPTPDETTCGWQWEKQALPDLSQKLYQTLQQASLPVESVNAEAFGENCIDSNGRFVRFAPMETDYMIHFQVADTISAAEQGDLITQTLEALEQYPIDQTPGPQPGYITIVFSSSGGEKVIRFIRTTGEQLRQKGLSGEALLQALQTQP